jgi:hypothetical protein
MKSKLLLSLLVVTGAVGCANNPKVDETLVKPTVYKLQNYTGPEAMGSNEVVQASKQCMFAKMKPNVHYLSVKTDQGRVMVPVSVICENY